MGEPRKSGGIMTTIQSAWKDKDGERHNYHVSDPIEVWEGFTFYPLHCSVIAVKNGLAETECVTVAGAKRRIQSGFHRWYDN